MNILIIRLSAIGDIVMASPLINALHQRYPGAEISWLVQPESVPLLSANQQLKRVIRWDKSEWARLRKEKKYSALYQGIRALRKELRSYEFDLVLDCQGLLKSGFLAWLSGANRRVGLGSREGSQYLMTEVIERGGDQDMIGSEYRYLAKHLGCDTSSFPMQLTTHHQSTEKAQDLIKGLEKIVIISPFTTRPQKHWFNDAWVSLAVLLKDHGYSVVMLGGPGDIDAAQEIAASVEINNLVGQTDLQTAAAIIKQADLQIGVDTGLTHMGIAQNIPVVALFGSTRPYLKADNLSAHVIYHDVSCAPCKRKPTCDGAYHCMRDITPAEVMGQVENVVMNQL